MEFPKDNNSSSTILCVSSEDFNTVMPLYIDPVSGGVLIDIELVADTTPVLPDKKAYKDNNSVSTSLVKDSESNDVSPLLIDNRNGNLWVELA